MGPKSGRAGLQSSKYAIHTDQNDAGVSLVAPSPPTPPLAYPDTSIEFPANFPFDILPKDDIEFMDPITVERSFLESLMRQLTLSKKGAASGKPPPDTPTAWVALDDGKFILEKAEYKALLEEKMQLQQRVGQVSAENESLKSEIETLREVVEKMTSTMGKSRGFSGFDSPRQSISGTSKVEINPSPTATDFADRTKIAPIGPKALKSRTTSTAGSHAGGSNGDGPPSKNAPKSPPLNTGGFGRDGNQNRRRGLGGNKTGGNARRFADQQKDDSWIDSSATANISHDSGWGNPSATATAQQDDGWGNPSTTANVKQDVGWGNPSATATAQQDDGWGNPTANVKQDDVWGNPSTAANVKQNDRWSNPPTAANVKQDNSWRNPESTPAVQGDSWGNPESTPAVQGDNWGNPKSTPAVQGDSWGSPQPTTNPPDDGWGNMPAATVRQDNNQGNSTIIGANDGATITSAEPLDWADNAAEASWENAQEEQTGKMSSWDFTPPLEPQNALGNDISVSALPPPASDSWRAPDSFADEQTVTSDSSNYRTLCISRLPSFTTLSHLVSIIRTNGKPLESISLSRHNKAGRGGAVEVEVSANITFTALESCNEFYNYLLTNTAQGNRGSGNGMDKAQIRLQPGGEKFFVERVDLGGQGDSGGIDVMAEVEKFGARRNLIVKNLPEEVTESDLVRLILPKGNYGLDQFGRWKWIENISVEQMDFNGRMTTQARINTAGIATAVSAKLRILKEYNPNPRNNAGRGVAPSVRIEYAKDECEGSLVEIPDWVVGTTDEASDRGAGGYHHSSHSYNGAGGPRRHGRGGGSNGGGVSGGAGRNRRQSSGGWN